MGYVLPPPPPKHRRPLPPDPIHPTSDVVKILVALGAMAVAAIILAIGALIGSMP